MFHQIYNFFLEGDLAMARKASKTNEVENNNKIETVIMTSEQALRMKLDCYVDLGFKQEITPIIMGRPGIGKSAIVADFAKQHNMYLIDIRMSQHDSTDIKGIPHFDEDTKTVKWVSADFIPLEGNKKIEEIVERNGYDGVLLFLDEVNRSDSQTLQSIFELVGDYKIGGVKLMNNCRVIAAGNLGTEDGCDVVDFDAALNRRLIKTVFRDNMRDWLDWAEKDNHVIPEITGFIKANPQYYYKVCGEGRNLTPANWDKFSKTIINNKSKYGIKEITEVVGPDVILDAAFPFLEYLKDLEKIGGKDIIERYDEIKEALESYEMSRKSQLTESLVNELKEHPELITKNTKGALNVARFLTEMLSSDIMIATILNMSNINEALVTAIGNAEPRLDDLMAEAFRRGFENR